ncbi:hypothetical protein CBM2585_A50047 [Cupriavidus taiwanensis]|nr:hypothetical protein CBM2585_A50047 [Cupriavidus taiwanensis]
MVDQLFYWQAFQVPAIDCEMLLTQPSSDAIRYDARLGLVVALAFDRLLPVTILRFHWGEKHLRGHVASISDVG